jgi:hypothetical protein
MAKIMGAIGVVQWNRYFPGCQDRVWEDPQDICFHLLSPPSKRAITLIISPLMAIEQDQALDLQRLFGNTCLPLVVDGKNNTPEVRHSIIMGNYTHIWVSAEVALGDLMPGKSKKSKQTRRRVIVYDESGYRDARSFTSILHNSTPVSLDRLIRSSAQDFK